MTVSYSLVVFLGSVHVEHAVAHVQAVCHLFLKTCHMHETNFIAAWYRSQALSLHAAVLRFSCVAFQLGRAKVNLIPLNHWAAWYNTGLLKKVTPSFLFFSFLFFSFLFFSFQLQAISASKRQTAADQTCCIGSSAGFHAVAPCVHSVQWGCRNSEQASGMCSICHATQAVWEETND